MSPIPVQDLLEGRVTGEPRPSTHPARVLDFLRENADQAYRAVEIARALDTDQHTIGAALRRLRGRGLVDKKDAYWYVLPREDAAHLRAAMRATRDADARLGPEDPEDWADLPRKD